MGKYHGRLEPNVVILPRKAERVQKMLKSKSGYYVTELATLLAEFELYIGAATEVVKITAVEL